MKTLFAFVAVPALALAGAFAQTITHPPTPTHLLASHIIVPQARAFTTHPSGALTITEVNVAVDIIEQVATTTMDISITNAAGARLEAQMMVPVPDKANKVRY